MKPKVNQDLCIGCGACEATCPKVFKVKEDSKSHVIDAKACADCDCQAACDACPVNAISLEE
jgi:ferredoxin